jgi:hypothetical protein
MANLTRIVILAAVSIAALAAPTAAQTRPQKPPPRARRPPGPPPRIDRGYVVGGAGFNLTPTTFSDVVRPLQFGEPGLVDSHFRLGSAPALDVAGAYHLRRRWWVGMELTSFSRSGTDAVTAQVPHPFVFNRLRDVSGDAHLHRQETGVHFQAIWTRPLFRKWQGSLSAGPSIMHASQDVVQDITVTQIYPFDTATFATAVSTRRSGTHLGFNLGGAADYAATRRVALRISLGASHARLALTTADSHTVKVSAGGVRVSGGVLFRF